MEVAVNHEAARSARNLWACLDNQAVIRRVYNPAAKSYSSQEDFTSIRKLLADWDTVKSPALRQFDGPTTAKVRWVPGHAGIPGNEAADKHAGQAAASALPRELRMTTAAGPRWARACL